MDISADRSTRTSVPRRQPASAGTLRLPRRRRPTGEAPPLPYHLQTSGVRWLVVGGVLMALTIVVFAGGMRGLAVNVTVVDDAVVQWLSRLQAPGLVGGPGGGWR
jgi:nicotinamidase-related amidase